MLVRPMQVLQLFKRRLCLPGITRTFLSIKPVPAAHTPIKNHWKATHQSTSGSFSILTRLINHTPSTDMTEVASLTVGVVALCGIFNNAVDCFQYVQLGKTFGRDYQTQLLKLDVAQLRLSRWGKAVGLGPDIESADEDSLRLSMIPEDDAKQAHDLLEQIIKLFGHAEASSKKQKRPKAEAEERDINEDATKQALHNKLKRLIIGRRGLRDLKQRTKWALYYSDQLSVLVRDVSGLVDDLIGLFPSTNAAQQQLCEDEVREIEIEVEVAELRSAAEGQDDMLEKAIDNLAPQVGRQPGGVSVNVTGGQHSGLIMGSNPGRIGDLRWGGA
jgi:hypothetical protein